MGFFSSIKQKIAKPFKAKTLEDNARERATFENRQYLERQKTSQEREQLRRELEAEKKAAAEAEKTAIERQGLESERAEIASLKAARGARPQESPASIFLGNIFAKLEPDKEDKRTYKGRVKEAFRGPEQNERKIREEIRLLKLRSKLAKERSSYDKLEPSLASTEQKGYNPPFYSPSTATGLGDMIGFGSTPTTKKAVPRRQAKPGPGQDFSEMLL